MIAQHSSESNEWYTPRDIVERVRHLMGGIDLDPATCVEANRTVKADCWYSAEEGDDGLAHEWKGKVFLNPPGGKINGRSSMQVWWNRLASDYEQRFVAQGFFVAFTLELLRSSQRGIPAQRYFRCYPSERIRFTGAGNSPTHANVLIWLPPRDLTPRNGFDPLAIFKRVFEEIGFCEGPANS